jgi:PKD repeat protein
MKLKHLISLVLLIALISTVSATTTFYLNSGNSDLTGGADFSKNLTTSTSTPSTLQMSIVKAATETQYAWTQAGIPNNADWETDGFTIRLNVTAVSTSTDIHINVQVDRVFANGTVRESSATSTERDITAAGLYTYSIASKDWSAGTATDRMRVRYLIRNSKTSAARTVDFSFNDINSYVITTVTNIPYPPVAAFSANVTTGGAPLSVLFTDASTNTPTNWDWYMWANETKTSDDQNPVITFTEVGTYNIRLYASNAGGGDWENKTGYITANAAAAPVASFTLNRNPTRIPNSITATDTSTNTPTSWEWSWGDGTANSTTQNPSHQYLKRGKWDIVLTATNAGGSGTTGTTSVKVVGYENN